MLGPFSRILLRYGSGALVTFGFITVDMGHMLVDDPDLVAITSWVLGGAAAVAAEGAYYLARKWGYRT